MGGPYVLYTEASKYRYGSNSSAVVQGAGLLGIYSCAWLRHRNHMENVFVVDTNEARLKLAEKFGVGNIESVLSDRETV